MTKPTRYSRVSDIVAADMDGERVMMNLATGEYVGLEGIGGTIWDLLETPRSLSEIEAQVLEEFMVDAETCRADIKEFLSDLTQKGLVRIV